MKRNGTPITDKHRKESKNLLDATAKVMKEEDPTLNRRASLYGDLIQLIGVSLATE